MPAIGGIKEILTNLAVILVMVQDAEKRR
jgi:hypothetical protein